MAVNEKYKDDKALVEGCAKGERPAQQELFNRFSGKMLSVCKRYAENQEEAEDMLQEGFLKVFVKIEFFKNEGSLEGWIRRIMVNTALDLLRKNKNLKNNVDLETTYNLSSNQENALQSLGAEELMKMLNEMPVGYRTVFNLFVIEGYSHKEIGEMLEISENTSKSQFSRARAHLKNLLEKYYV
jgi:RNA polymerase sigma factor (sigma-70 family)